MIFLIHLEAADIQKSSFTYTTTAALEEKRRVLTSESCSGTDEVVMVATITRSYQLSRRRHYRIRQSHRPAGPLLALSTVAQTLFHLVLPSNAA